MSDRSAVHLDLIGGGVCAEKIGMDGSGEDGDEGAGRENGG
jgi:hypothetical protein